MGRRELCICCFQLVTKAQLKKHAAEAARRERIIAMGGDPSIPDIPLRIKPITGNDIFPRRTPVPSLEPPVGDHAFRPEGFPKSPPPPPSPPHFIEDDRYHLTPLEQTAPFQVARNHDAQTSTGSAEETIGQSTSTPLSLFRNPERQLAAVSRQKPRRDIEMGGQRSLPQPPLQIVYQLVDPTPGALEFIELSRDTHERIHRPVQYRTATTRFAPPSSRLRSVPRPIAVFPPSTGSSGTTESAYTFTRQRGYHARS